MDLNQLYFQHQLSVMRAERAPTPIGREVHDLRASEIAGRIGRIQHGLGAAAACDWTARSRDNRKAA